MILSRKWKDNPQNGRKYLHIRASVKDPVNRAYEEQLNNPPNLKAGKGFE